MKLYYTVLLLFILFFPCATLAQQGDTDESPEEMGITAQYQSIDTIFVELYIKIDHPKGLGIDTKKLYDYVVSRCNFTFGDIRCLPLYQKDNSGVRYFTEAYSRWLKNNLLGGVHGVLEIDITAVGKDNYPIAYHIAYKFGSSGIDEKHQDAVLGYNAADAIKNVIQNTISEFVKESESYYRHIISDS